MHKWQMRVCDMVDYWDAFAYYLPSNLLQPYSVACVSFQIIVRIFTLI